MTGSLFSVSNVSGFPIVEAFSDNKVTLRSYSNPVTITSTGNISGSATSTGSFGDVTSVGTIRSSEIEVDSGDVINLNGEFIKIGTATSTLAGGIHCKNPASQNGVAIFESGDQYVNITQKIAVVKDICNLRGSNEWYFQHADLYLSSTKVSGSAATTGSFGVIEVDGGHFTSASLANWWWF